MRHRLSVVFGGLILALLLLVPTRSRSQASKPDAKGCADSPFLGRVSGCYIYSCDRNQWDAVKIPVGPDRKVETIEGEKLHIYYECAAESYSRIKVVKNAEAALRQAGYTIVFSGTYDGDPALTARRGPQWIFVSTGNDRYWVDTVKAKEMAQEMQATAETMKKDISATGHVAVYGIYFDTDKAEVKPESEPALVEMAKLLKANPDLNVFIVGHTDNSGALEHNMKLSQERAASVANALTRRFGIVPARLRPMGLASLAPAASNRTEEGRAKNRRVELVEK